MYWPVEFVQAIESSFAAAALMAVVAQVTRSLAERRQRLRGIEQEQELVAQLATLQAEIESSPDTASLPVGPRSSNGTTVDLRSSESDRRLAELQRELGSTKEQLRDLRSSTPFEREARNTKWSSRVAFAGGFMVVAVVIAIGGQEWLSTGQPVELTTGAGLARLGVVGSAFYLAGQLFRRSTVLQGRAQDFERSAIAMRSVRILADDFSERATRDAFVRSIYEYHLGQRVDPKSQKDSGGEGGLDIVQLVEMANKIRAK